MTAHQHRDAGGRLNATQAAAYCSTGRRTWFRWRSTDRRLRDITHVDPSGRPYWLRAELDAWLREAPTPPADLAAAAAGTSSQRGTSSSSPPPAVATPRRGGRVQLSRSAPTSFAETARAAGATRRRVTG